MKERTVIQSLKELNLVERKQALWAAFSGAAVIFLLVVLAFFVWGTPRWNNDLFSYCISWIVLTTVSALVCAIGASIGMQLKLFYLGYSMPWTDYESTSTESMRFDTPHSQRSNDYSSPVRINPSSGQPMAGSSRVDISGNPYGTRSW